MKKNLLYMGFILVAGMIGGYFITQSGQFGDSQSLSTNQAGGVGYGNRGQNGQPDRNSCLADDCLMVEDLEYPADELPAEVYKALDEAINDEYKALAVYEEVIAKFGSVRPFSMIKGAEEQHIALLKAVYTKYGLEVPENNWPSKVSVPATLKEACQAGVDAEIANASLYKNKLLPAVADYEDMVSVFNNLMSASEEKHLPAFERCN